MSVQKRIGHSETLYNMETKSGRQQSGLKLALGHGGNGLPPHELIERVNSRMGKVHRLARPGQERRIYAASPPIERIGRPFKTDEINRLKTDA